jgi:hypothetical protein
MLCMGQFNGEISPPKVIVGSVVGCFFGYKNPHRLVKGLGTRDVSAETGSQWVRTSGARHGDVKRRDV